MTTKPEPHPRPTPASRCRTKPTRCPGTNPKLLILEPLNELFDGDEMQRRQARQFIGNLRQLARKRNMGVMLGAHPSNASMTERRPGAGSNGWNAAVRMRWWLEIVREVGDATNERKLHRMKVTGAYNDRAPIDLVVGDGGWLVMKDAPRPMVVSGDRLDLTASSDKTARDEQDFLDFVAERERQGRPASTWRCHRRKCRRQPSRTCE